MTEKLFCVYIMANKRNGTLYIGVTNNLPKRVWQHKEKAADGFTKRHGIDKLMYYETHENAESAITYEKKLKNRPRAFKIKLIEQQNPQWKDQYEEICHHH